MDRDFEDWDDWIDCDDWEGEEIWERLREKESRCAHTEFENLLFLIAEESLGTPTDEGFQIHREHGGITGDSTSTL